MYVIHINIGIVFYCAISAFQGVESNACNGTEMVINGTEGTISSPNYPNNYEEFTKCAWKIQAPNDMVIEVRFEPIFGIEWEFLCGYDSIYFLEPDLKHCGSYALQSFVSETNVLTVSFTSDEAITSTGFSFNWTAVEASSIPAPQYIELFGNEGQISSPNYPCNYGEFLDYTWKINASTAKSGILVEFEPLFVMQQSLGCIYDYLIISENDPRTSSENQILICSYEEKKLFISNAIYIRFQTDSSVTGAGFSLNYTTIDPPTCDGVTQQSGTTGVISTPLYPNRYLPSMDCTWQVTTPENTVIAVHINTNFSLANTYNCIADYLQVFDGQNSSAIQFGLNFCGIFAPRSFVTTRNALTVRFVSSSETSFSNFGFSISWTAEDKCQSDEFTCWDGSCITESAKCNSTVDCPNDMADEASCVAENSDQCGVSDIEAQFKWHSRIVGGYDAVKGSWPWQAHINTVINGQWFFMCGAVLISNRWVLTAAHCIFPGVDSTIVTFGDHDLSDEDLETEQAIAVQRTFLHPQYNYLDPQGFVNGYDIALLYLEAPVNYTMWVKPVCLPNYEVGEGDNIVLTGWGRTKFGGAPSDILKQVVSPANSRENCRVRTLISDYSDSLICAGLPYGGADTCQGDSGGPALTLQNGSWVVAGLASFGSVCGAWTIPGSYANVHFLLPYIADVMAIGPKEIPIVNNVISGKTSGVISSPNFGSGIYPGGVHIRWSIIAEAEKLIQIRFNESFRIHQYPRGPPCGGDYLLIYDGSSTLAKKYGDKRICGYSRPLDMESQSNVVIVEFFSDYYFEDTGFSIEWQVVDDCAANEFRCWDQSCLADSVKCDGNHDCPSKVDEFECAFASPGSTECGKTEVAPEFPFSPLVIGGSNAKDGSWPWQVGIYSDFGSGTSHTCGGSIISEYWVLTAANCIQAGANIEVVIGDYNRSSDSESIHEKRIKVEAAIQHPGYSSWARADDVGLLKLESPIDFTSKWYKPICLPPKDTMHPSANTTCVVTGWGVTGPSQQLRPPDILQQLQVKILNDSECKIAYSYYDQGDIKFICAGYLERDVGACFSDLGSPLVCEEEGKWVQRGIASSFTGGCGSRTFYARVSAHRDLIDDVINNFKMCSDSEVIEGPTSGEIGPPIVNGNYLTSISCSWLIRGKPNTVITIQFEFFDLEECISFYDFVNIYDGNSTSARKVYDTILCGATETIRGFESSSNELLITFESDASTTATGFKINWMIVDDCTSDQFRCWESSCIEKSLQCDGKSDCVDDSDEKECAIREGECGKQEIVPEFLWHARIVGGHLAKDGSWPFIVQIENMVYSNFVCAGTIVNDRWILTSGMCAAYVLPEQVAVVVGSNEFLPRNATRYYVESAYFPDEVFTNSLMGTVGLLKLKTRISFSPSVQPACLSLPEITQDPKAGEYCVALGWGASLSEQTWITGSLRQSQVPIVSDEICDTAGTWDLNTTFCGGSGGVGACSTDDGGPVMCFRDNVWVQFGVILSHSCGKFGFFDFYTRVSAHENWIEETMNMTLPKHFAGTTTMTASTTRTTSATITTTTIESSETPGNSQTVSASTVSATSATTTTTTTESSETPGHSETNVSASTVSGTSETGSTMTHGTFSADVSTSTDAGTITASATTSGGTPITPMYMYILLLITLMVTMVQRKMDFGL